jgi:hypothetical protein
MPLPAPARRALFALAAEHCQRAQIEPHQQFAQPAAYQAHGWRRIEKAAQDANDPQPERSQSPGERRVDADERGKRKEPVPCHGNVSGLTAPSSMRRLRPVRGCTTSSGTVLPTMGLSRLGMAPMSCPYSLHSSRSKHTRLPTSLEDTPVAIHARCLPPPTKEIQQELSSAT